MSLSPDEISKILATPEKPQRVKKPLVDPNVRDYDTWFKMRHCLIRTDTNEVARCSNPQCPEPKRHMVAEIPEGSGLYMCRLCFLEGYGLSSIDQLSLE